MGNSERDETAWRIFKDVDDDFSGAVPRVLVSAGNEGVATGYLANTHGLLKKEKTVIDETVTGRLKEMLTQYVLTDKGLELKRQIDEAIEPDRNYDNTIAGRNCSTMRCIGKTFGTARKRFAGLSPRSLSALLLSA